MPINFNKLDKCENLTIDQIENELKNAHVEYGFSGRKVKIGDESCSMKKIYENVNKWMVQQNVSSMDRFIVFNRINELDQNSLQGDKGGWQKWTNFLKHLPWVKSFEETRELLSSAIKFNKTRYLEENSVLGNDNVAELKILESAVTEEKYRYLKDNRIEAELNNINDIPKNYLFVQFYLFFDKIKKIIEDKDVQQNKVAILRAVYDIGSYLHFSYIPDEKGEEKINSSLETGMKRLEECLSLLKDNPDLKFDATDGTRLGSILTSFAIISDDEYAENQKNLSRVFKKI